MSAFSSPILQHFFYFAGGIVIGAIAAMVIQPDSIQQFLSYLTAYAGFLYLAIALILAPLNLLKGRPLGLSSKLRRNFGIWAGVFALAHLGAGLTVHFGGRWWLYFLQPMRENKLIPFRFDFFGAANYLGLIAIIIFCVLLALSNDASIRKFGPVRWKRIQQLSYPLMLITFAHGIIYQLLEKRSFIFLMILALGFCAVLMIQIKGAVFKRAAGRIGASASVKKP